MEKLKAFSMIGTKMKKNNSKILLDNSKQNMIQYTCKKEKGIKMYLVIMYIAGWHEVDYKKCSSYEEAEQVLEQILNEDVDNCGEIVIL